VKAPVHGAVGPWIQITLDGQRRLLPLQAATPPGAGQTGSAAELVQARSGVVPFAARTDLLDRLVEWTRAPGSFAGGVIGGRAGAGKTRLGVELCERSTQAGWLSGLLSPNADPAALEALVEAPAPRLVVVDDAESKTEQLEVVLPALAIRATPEHPVRVLMLVRSAAGETNGWTEALRRRRDVLAVMLDEVQVRLLDDEPLGNDERVAVFRAAASAFTKRAGRGTLGRPAPPGGLAEAMFADPLLVVVAAYLAVHDHGTGLPATRGELLEALAVHEDGYWAASASGLGTDDVLRRRVVALATLTGADSEDEAVGLLRLVPDLPDTSREGLGRLARWAHALYPGPRWWNPLEPDLLGEHLVATSFSGCPDVLAGVLDRGSSARVVQLLDVCARAAAEHPQLAAALGPVLSQSLVRLCSVAADDAAPTSEIETRLDGPTMASALGRAVAAIAVDPASLRSALDSLPPHPDPRLSPLALAFATELVAGHRRLSVEDPLTHQPALARSLTDQSMHLVAAGQSDDGLGASKEAVAVHRRLAAADPAHEHLLALALNVLSIRLAAAGRRRDGLDASLEAVAQERGLAAADPAAHESALAEFLNTLSIRLAEAGRDDEGLTACEEAVALDRRLATSDRVAHEPALANALKTLSIRLAESGRRREGLAVGEEAVTLTRRLADHDPTGFEPALACGLNSLSNRLAEMGRGDEGLTVIEEAVALYRRLAAGDQATFDPAVAATLNNLSNRLAEAGRPGEGLAAAWEAVAVYRRLAAADPGTFNLAVAASLNNLSNRLAETGRADEARAAIHEAVALNRRLAAVPYADHTYLATALNNLSAQPADAGGCGEEQAAAEAVAHYRRMAADSPAAHEPSLATALNNLSVQQAAAGRHGEALASIEEAVALYTRLAATELAAHQSALATALFNLSVLSEASPLDS